MHTTNMTTQAHNCIQVAIATQLHNRSWEICQGSDTPARQQNHGSEIADSQKRAQENTQYL